MIDCWSNILPDKDLHQRNIRMIGQQAKRNNLIFRNNYNQRIKEILN
jgi:hypothetical protein